MDQGPTAERPEIVDFFSGILPLPFEGGHPFIQACSDFRTVLFSNASTLHYS